MPEDKLYYIRLRDRRNGPQVYLMFQYKFVLGAWYAVPEEIVHP